MMTVNLLFVLGMRLVESVGYTWPEAKAPRCGDGDEKPLVPRTRGFFSDRTGRIEAHPLERRVDAIR
jgi:hypothetical protein